MLKNRNSKRADKKTNVIVILLSEAIESEVKLQVVRLSIVIHCI